MAWRFSNFSFTVGQTLSENIRDLGLTGVYETELITGDAPAPLLVHVMTAPSWEPFDAEVEFVRVVKA